MTTNEPPPSSGPSYPDYGSVPPPPGSEQPPAGGYPPPPAGGYPPPPGGGYPPPPGSYGAPGGYGPAPQGNQKALWSMILGIVSILCCGVITGPIAIVLSTQAKGEIAASHGTQTGEGQAKAGLILGIIGIVLWVLWIVFNVAVGFTF